MSYVQYIWILLSILVSITCSFCFMQPEWIMHVNYTNTFGIYTYCVSQRVGMDTRACGFYGGRFGFGNIPSTTWQAACLLYGGGCLLTCFGALCSLATMCVRTQLEMTLVMSTRYLQTSAVFLMASGLFVYHMSFESNYFRLYCGTKSAMFYADTCAVGWTYVLAIVGCAISIFCPILSLFLGIEYDSHSNECKL
ncbi:LHFPL tetraspan subfamily member 7 protein-like [Dreissena polymorpha]|uniref:LHFPL tetraspan subfamily member 7 protein-like n=1 Tax=Dreissena polymorpha TaxID=45954 RepID=UPI0022656E74|nr:LHFPL tetraspan subfamily member 7 protein-like [Dreissena polymorpha]